MNDATELCQCDFRAIPLACPHLVVPWLWLTSSYSDWLSTLPSTHYCQRTPYIEMPKVSLQIYLSHSSTHMSSMAPHCLQVEKSLASCHGLWTLGGSNPSEWPVAEICHIVLTSLVITHATSPCLECLCHPHPRLYLADSYRSLTQVWNHLLDDVFPDLSLRRNQPFPPLS